jgi:hypothetical protein
LRKFAGSRRPVSARPPKCDGIAINTRDGERRLALRIVPPLVINRGWDQAPAAGERLAEHPGGGDRLRTRIDRLARLLQILREIRHQAPFQRIQVSLSRGRMKPDHGRVAAGSHVPGELEIRRRVSRLEKLGEKIRRQKTRVTTTHVGDVGWVKDDIQRDGDGKRGRAMGPTPSTSSRGAAISWVPR